MRAEQQDHQSLNNYCGFGVTSSRLRGVVLTPPQTQKITIYQTINRVTHQKIRILQNYHDHLSDLYSPRIMWLDNGAMIPSELHGPEAKNSIHRPANARLNVSCLYRLLCRMLQRYGKMEARRRELGHARRDHSNYRGR